MKSAIRYVSSIYASIFFMFWIIVAFISYLFVSLFFGKKKDREFLIFLYRFIGRAIGYTLFLSVEKRIHYTYNIEDSYVVVSNHQTMMDIPANVIGTPNEILFKFLGKKEAARLPFFGYLITRLCILVDRKDDKSRKESYQQMKTEMDKGYSIFIYPEGTRNRTPELIKDFYDGAFKLAVETQKPIVVNTLVGIKELNPPTGFFTYLPGKIDAHWEEPISTIGLSQEDIPMLKKKVGDIMISRLREGLA